MEALLIARNVSSDVSPIGDSLQWHGDYQVPDVADFLLDNDLLPLLTRQKFTPKYLISELITSQVDGYRRVALKAKRYRRKTLHNIRVVLRQTTTSAVELGLVNLSKAELSETSKSLRGNDPLPCGKLTKLGPVMPLCVRDVLYGVPQKTLPSPLRSLIERAAQLSELCQRIIQAVILVVAGTENSNLLANINDAQRSFTDRAIMSLRGPHLNWSDADVKEALQLSKRLGSRTRQRQASTSVPRETTPISTTTNSTPINSTTPAQTTRSSDSPPLPLQPLRQLQRLRIATGTSLPFASDDLPLGCLYIAHFRSS
ncbi:MAG: hypothetical protein KVP17_004446 [Porospora cf. gigantea B]|uniref:uncharacterized protein n=1 Tax=Porospora cf. gigantea B TaxID=2853592 RepID=UPI003571C5F2|nr:MAG: hypothetical protein KVP17_004446 [Porospora cf. gigantea B]